MAHFITETTSEITAPSLEEWGGGLGKKGKEREVWGRVWGGFWRENVSERNFLEIYQDLL